MRIRSKLAQITNKVIRPLGTQIRRVETEKPWDVNFREIKNAEAIGIDPNDLGDVAWNDDPLKRAFERHCLPHVNPESVVLELGPGTGRLTRHLIGRCKRIILVDYSRFICEWLEHYLRGKGCFEVHQSNFYNDRREPLRLYRSEKRGDDSMTPRPGVLRSRLNARVDRQ